MKKTIIIVVALIFLAVIFAGCGDDSNDTSASAGPAALKPLEVVGKGSYTHEIFGVTTAFKVPEGWCARLNTDGWRISVYNISPQDEDFNYNGTPMIGITFEEDSSDFVSPEYTRRIDDRVIGGIEMEGHMGIMVDDEFIFYLGYADNGVLIEVSSFFDLDIQSGEGKAVLDSIQFTVD